MLLLRSCKGSSRLVEAVDGAAGFGGGVEGFLLLVMMVGGSVRDGVAGGWVVWHGALAVVQR